MVICLTWGTNRERRKQKTALKGRGIETTAKRVIALARVERLGAYVVGCSNGST
jgi:hypothetical protein